MITRLKAADAWPDLEDDASALVAANDGEEATLRRLGEVPSLLTGTDVTPAQVLVGMTKAGSFPLDQNLLLPRWIQLDFLDTPVLPTTEEDRSVRLHVDTPEL
jgi:hypothetical protein